MIELMQSMAWPFAACLVLTGIHVYLGIHVIERRVVFVDLALAQIAALGAVWGVLMGWSLEDDSWTVKSISLCFTFIGAAIFAMTRTRRERIPHEAIIGIIYAVALAATVMASSNLAHGAEEVRSLLSGSILWVRKETVLWTAGLYFAIGVVHWVFRGPFFELSAAGGRQEQSAQPELDARARMWDFLFYVTFGFVVTSSVSIGGVLLVFTYLVIPAVAAMMVANTIRARLVFGWVSGTIVSAIGVVVSYQGDLPSGPTIVVCFGVFLAVMGLGQAVVRSANPVGTGAKFLGLLLALGAFLAGTWYLQPVEHDTLDHRLTSSMATERLAAVQEVVADPALDFEARPYLPDLLVDSDPSVRLEALELVIRRPEPELVELVADLLGDSDDLWREEAVRVLREIGDARYAPHLVAAAEAEQDWYLKVELGLALRDLGDSRGREILLEVLDQAPSELARGEAWSALKSRLPADQGFDVGRPPDENDAAIADLRARLDRGERR